MKLAEAEQIANEVLAKICNHFQKWHICGSIRRQKPVVNDIDIVAIRKPEGDYQFGEISLEREVLNLDPMGFSQAKALGNKGASRFLNGDKIKRFQYHGIMIDLYLATEKTFGTLVLIRTGSAEHNVRLTTLAMGQSMKLKANGDGLVDRNNEKMVFENTEEGILMKLLGRVPPPEQRN